MPIDFPDPAVQPEFEIEDRTYIHNGIGWVIKDPTGAIITEYYSVVEFANRAAAIASVVIGSQIPNSITGLVYTTGQLIAVPAGPFRGEIYQVNADGTKTLLLPVAYNVDGIGTFFRIAQCYHDRTIMFKVVAGVISQTVTLSNFRSTGLLHGTEYLSTVLGTKTDLVTIDKDNLVDAINEVALHTTDLLGSFPQAQLSTLIDTSVVWDDYDNAGDGFIVASRIGVTTSVASQRAAISKEVSLNLINKDLRIVLSCSDWAAVSNCALYLGSDSYTLSHAVIVDFKARLQNPPNFEWVELIVPLTGIVFEGNVDLANINIALLTLRDNGSNRVSLTVDEIQSFSRKSKPMVSICVDDGLDATFPAKQLMQDRGWAGTLFVSHDDVNTVNFLSQDQLDDFSDLGWDLGGHSSLDLKTLSTTDLDNYLRASAYYLRTKKYKGSDLFAFPYGSWNQNVINYVSKYFNAGFNIDGYVQPVSYVSPFRINRHSIDRFTTVEMVKTWVQQAINDGSWCILNFHTFVDTLVDDVDWLTSDFATLLAYIDSTGIDVLPISEALARLRRPTEVIEATTGNLDDLVTTDRRDLVKAINEVELGKIETPPSLEGLFIYYGYPISLFGWYNVQSVIDYISSKYKYWVVGDSYNDSLHEEYASTVAIINGVRANGVIVFGYVPIGANTQNLTLAQMSLKVDHWETIGVDGIFLDEFGFDYHNTRTRQIDIVNYVHSKNLPYVANAWTVEDFCLDNISEVSWASGDWRYVNFATYNPTNLVLPRNPNDVYLIENFCIDNTTPLTKWDAQERFINVKARSIAKNFKVWALAVVGETASPGTINLTKIGNLKDEDGIGTYVSANAYIYGFTVVGIGGFSFGAGGTPIKDKLKSLPIGSSPAIFDHISNFTTSTFSRSFGSTVVTVKNANKNTISVTVEKSQEYLGEVKENLTLLTTTDKSSLVAAVNEVKASITSVAPVTIDRRVYTQPDLTGETTFNVVYSGDNVIVVLNGILIPKTDYVATTQTNIVLDVPLTSDDLVLEVIGYSDFAVADALTPAIAATTYVPQNLSTVTERTTLDGTEFLAGVFSGLKKFTVEKIRQFITASNNVWYAINSFKVIIFHSQYNVGSSGTAATINFANGQKQSILLTGNATLTLQFPGVGNYQLIMTQDGTGNRTVTWAGYPVYYVGSATAPAINLTANTMTIVSVYFNGGNAMWLGASKVNA